MSEDNSIKIRVETEGFEEAIEQVDTLATAYDGFPAQVTIRGCTDCVFHIHPTQVRVVDEREEKK